MLNNLPVDRNQTGEARKLKMSRKSKEEDGQFVIPIIRQQMQKKMHNQCQVV